MAFPSAEYNDNHPDEMDIIRMIFCFGWEINRSPDATLNSTPYYG
jgi:hypothetical protein